MKAICSRPSSELSSLFRRAFYIVRAQVTSPEKYPCCQAGAFSTDLAVHGSFNPIVEPPTLLAAEKRKAKSVLNLFLKQQGLSKAVAARTINRSEPFIDHLVSRLHSTHKSRDLLGRELTNLEIRNSLFHYLENLLEEHGNLLVDVMQNFPNANVKENTAEPNSQPCCSLDSKKRKSVSRVNKGGSEREICPKHLYLMKLGMDLEQIKVIVRKFPMFACYSLERKIVPLVSFLLHLGVPKSHISKILCRCPQLCGLRLSENIRPMMMFLENLGVDKKQWAKVIYRCPSLLSLSRHKVQATIDFLSELGLSAESIGKIITRFPYIACYSVEDNLRPKAEYFRSLGVDVSESIGKIITRFPNIIGCSVEDNLQPKVEYFRSLGVDVATILCRAPHAFSLNIETHLKPLTEFFLDRGFNVEEIRSMISKCAVLYDISLTKNLIPKWEFFLTTGYSKLDLVKFPHYFTYSLEERIRPRYTLVKQSGVKMGLSNLLAMSGSKFEKTLMMRRKKMLSDEGLGGKDSR